MVDDVEGTDESEGVDELAPPNDPKVLLKRSVSKASVPSHPFAGRNRNPLLSHLVDPKPKLRPPFAVGAAGGAGADAPKSGLLMEFVADAPNSGGFCASMDAANAAPNGDGLKLSDEAVVADPKKDGGFVASGALPNDENSGFAVVEDPNRPVPEDGPVRAENIDQIFEIGRHSFKGNSRFPADSAFVVVPRRPPEDETWLEFVDEAPKMEPFPNEGIFEAGPSSFMSNILNGLAVDDAEPNTNGVGAVVAAGCEPVTAGAAVVAGVGADEVDVSREPDEKDVLNSEVDDDEPNSGGFAPDPKIAVPALKRINSFLYLHYLWKVLRHTQEKTQALVALPPPSSPMNSQKRLKKAEICEITEPNLVLSKLEQRLTRR